MSQLDCKTLRIVLKNTMGHTLATLTLNDESSSMELSNVIHVACFLSSYASFQRTKVASAPPTLNK